MSISEAVRRARWVEAETLYLKRKGLSFEQIAGQIARVGRGQVQAMVAIPDGITFPPDYTISRQACHKAFRKAIAREPSLEVEELRKVDNARSEEIFLTLQPLIQKGNLRAVEVGIKVLDHTAKIQGYAAPPGLRHLQASPLTSPGITQINVNDVRSIPLSVIDLLTSDEGRMVNIERKLLADDSAGGKVSIEEIDAITSTDGDS